MIGTVTKITSGVSSDTIIGDDTNVNVEASTEQYCKGLTAALEAEHPYADVSIIPNSIARLEVEVEDEPITSDADVYHDVKQTFQDFWVGFEWVVGINSNAEAERLFEIEQPPAQSEQAQAETSVSEQVATREQQEAFVNLLSGVNVEDSRAILSEDIAPTEAQELGVSEEVLDAAMNGDVQAIQRWYEDAQRCRSADDEVKAMKTEHELALKNLQTGWDNSEKYWRDEKTRLLNELKKDADAFVE